MSARRLAPQLDLFAVRRPGGFAGGERHMLDEGSWVDHFPGWLPVTGPLHGALAELGAWEQRSRWMFTKNVIEPRLTAEYDAIATAGVPELVDIAEAISRHYGVVYDSAWMNLYRDQEDATGWHADRPANLLPTAIVPVLSLGATRRFLLRKAGGGKSTTFEVATGDLVVMGGRCQRDWVHMVPREPFPTGPRISVNFGSSTQRKRSQTAATPPSTKSS